MKTLINLLGILKNIKGNFKMENFMDKELCLSMI